MFRKSKKIVTAHIVDEHVKLAVIEARNDSRKIEYLTQLPLQETQLREFIKVHKLKGQAVYLALGGKQIVTRVINVPEMPRQELKKALQWEVTKYIPIPPEELIFDFQILDTIQSTGGKQLRIMIIAAKQQYIENFCDFFAKVGLKPKVVDVEGAILQYLYASLVKNQDSAACCIYLEDKRGVVSFITNKRLFFIHNVEWDNDVIVGRITSEYQRVSNYLQRQLQMNMPTDIYLLGPEAKENLRVSLGAELNINIQCLNLTEKLRGSKLMIDSIDPYYTFATGLALREVDYVR